MKFRKTLLIILAFSLVLTLSLVGAMFAYMYRQTNTVTNTFDVANVACQVLEDFSDKTSKKSIVVENTSNIEAYLRVRMVSYWVNSDEKIVAKASPEIAFDPDDGWIPMGGDTYCYKYPVVPGGQTSNLLKAPITLVTEEGYRQVVEVFAEAIQSKPADAVKVWSVTVNEDGSLSKATQTQ